MAQVPVVEDNYIGDGANRVFGLTWPYLSPVEVFVSVDGVNVSFAWLSGSSSTVQTTVAPAIGSAVRVYRNTRAVEPLHTFAAGVPFLPRYVDENAEQLLYAVQEGYAFANAANADAAAALAAANDAVTVANSADVVANAADSKADAALLASGTASTNAADALAVANGVDAKATTALAQSSEALALAEEAIDAVEAAGVASFNGRSGVVVPVEGDYTAAMVGYGGGTVADKFGNLDLSVSNLTSTKMNVSVLAANGGADLVGTSGGSTVQAELTSLTGRALARVTYVDTLGAMRNVDKTKYAMCFTLGYWAYGDSGGGQYYWDSADNTSADNGFDIIVATDGARWKLVHNGTVHIEQTGAKPDNTTNCVASLLVAVGRPRVRQVLFGKGTYAFNGACALPIGVTLTGIPGGGTQLALYGTASVFFLRSLTNISGMQIDCAGLSTGCFAFTLATSLSGIEYVTIRDVILYHSKGFLTDENHATNVATNVRISGISSRLTKGRGLWLRDAFAFLECRDIAIDYIGNTVAQNYVGFDISFNEGSMFDNCEVTGTTGIVAGTSASQIGYNFTSCKAVYLRRSFSDAAGGSGMRFSSCQYVRAELCSISLADDHCLYFISCSDVQFTNMYVGGRRGISGATAGSYGVYLNSCVRVQLTTVEVINTPGTCLLSAASVTQLVINGCIFSSSGGYGLATPAGSVSITTGTLFVGNVAGNYVLATGTDHLSGCQNNGGSLLNVTGPASG